MFLADVARRGDANRLLKYPRDATRPGHFGRKRQR